jgi:hypothetical protein
VYMLAFTRKKHDNPNTSLLLTAGHAVTVIGVVLSCLIAFIVLMIYAPNLVGGGEVEHVLENTPAQDGKAEGLVMFVYLDAIIGNFSAGSAVALFLAYTTKRDQTTEEVVSHVKVDSR